MIFSEIYLEGQLKIFTKMARYRQGEGVSRQKQVDLIMELVIGWIRKRKE